MKKKNLTLHLYIYIINNQAAINFIDTKFKISFLDDQEQFPSDQQYQSSCEML